MAVVIEVQAYRREAVMFGYWKLPTTATFWSAAVLGINQGRVSEMLRGKRFPDVPPAP